MKNGMITDDQYLLNSWILMNLTQAIASIIHSSFHQQCESTRTKMKNHSAFSYRFSRKIDSVIGFTCYKLHYLGCSILLHTPQTYFLHCLPISSLLMYTYKQDRSNEILHISCLLEITANINFCYVILIFDI